MSSRHAAALLYGALALGGCSEGARTVDKSAEAARADSSAAGYAVGPATGDSTPRTSVRRDTAVIPVPTAVARATPVRRDTIVAAQPTVVPDSDSVGARTTPGAVKLPPLPIGTAHVNEFLSYDAQAKLVTLLLIAGYNGLNGGLNYNGGAQGSHGVSIPFGWTVRVSVINRDSDLQHSAIAIRQILPPPEEMPAPAFAGAMLSQLEEGIHEGDTTAFTFVADKAGRYMFACGVPGHAQGGMWMHLAVSKDIDRPSYP